MTVPLHGDLTSAANLHRIGVIQSADPGAIGAGKVWIDSDDNAIRIRNATDTGWLGPLATGSAYTDEQAQDAVGAMVDSTLEYVDATPLLRRAALTGSVTAAAGSNTTAIANDVSLPGNPTTTTQSSGDSSTKIATTAFVADAVAKQKEVLIVACSDETTAITTGTAKVTFRMPFAMTLTEVRASVTTAPTGATLTIDINEGGTTILSTKLTIDASEKTSTTAATAAVISDSALADDAEMTIDFDQVGSTIAGAGVKVYFIGTRT